MLIVYGGFWILYSCEILLDWEKSLLTPCIYFYFSYFISINNANSTSTSVPQTRTQSGLSWVCAMPWLVCLQQFAFIELFRGRDYVGRGKEKKTQLFI